MPRSRYRFARSKVSGDRVPVPIDKATVPVEVSSVMDDVETDYASVIDGEVSDVIAPAIASGQMQLGRESSIRSHVRRLLDGVRGPIVEVFRDGVVDAIGAGREAAFRQYTLSEHLDAELVPPEQIASDNGLFGWVEDAVDSTLDTLADQIARQARAAHSNGADAEAVAGHVDETVLTGWQQGWKSSEQARTLARTGSNAGRDAAFKWAPKVVGEEWVSLGEDPRDAHANADGQVVPPRAGFVLGNYLASYPGDPSLPPGQALNCRCQVTPVFASQLTRGQLAQLSAGRRIYL